jgi:hypothetical protein
LVFNTVPEILGLITTRCLREEDSLEISLFMRMQCIHIHRLKPLSDKGTIELACLSLGVKSLPSSLKNIFVARSQGKPLYIEELARSILHENILKIVNGQCVFANGSNNVISKLVHSIPANIREWVASRIDRMEPAPQLTLQVISVLGHEVSIDLLLAAHQHPHVTLQSLKRDIHVLEGENFLSSTDSGAGDGSLLLVFQVCSTVSSPKSRIDC